MTDINVNFDKCGFFAKKFLNGYMTANLIEFGTNRYGFIISIFDLSYNFIGSYADYIYSDLDLAIGQANYQFNDFLKSEKAINLEYAKDECDSRTHQEGYCLGEILKNKKTIMEENNGRQNC